jgi:hypothetical protein
MTEPTCVWDLDDLDTFLALGGEIPELADDRWGWVQKLQWDDDRWGWVQKLQRDVDVVPEPVIEDEADMVEFIDEHCGRNLFTLQDGYPEIKCDEVDPELPECYRLALPEEALCAHSLSYAAQAGDYVSAGMLHPTFCSA